MAIVLECPDCQKRFRAPSEKSKQGVACPECGTNVRPRKSRGTNAKKPPATKKKKRRDSSQQAMTAIDAGQRHCPDCRAAVSEGEPYCINCGLRMLPRKKKKTGGKTRSKKRKREQDTGPDWRESFFGTIAFAPLAVFRGVGWACWLWCAGVMVALSVPGIALGLMMMCVPIVGPFVALAIWFLTFAIPPSGFMSRNMELASRDGARGVMQHWEMSVMDEMVPAALAILKVNVFLSIIPLVAATLIAMFFGVVDLAAPQGGSQGVFAATGGFLSTAIYFLLTVLCTFCGPMCIMLLGVTDSDSALYPPNVFRALGRVFVQYIGFYISLVLLALFGYVVVIVPSMMLLAGVGAAFGSASGGEWLILFIAIFGGLLIGSLIAVYIAGMFGWSMGMFLRRNIDHFEGIGS